MIIKSISKYFYINKFTYFFIVLCLLKASFKPVIFVSILLVFHELGHFLTAFLFGVEVDKIYLYPFGGISKFYIPLNYSNLKEFIILLNGPLFQELIKNILIIIFPINSLIIISYHYSILIFNLLPIYPLDGGKLLNIIFSIFIPYKKSLKISIYISYIAILLLLLINLSSIKINCICMFSFLIYKVHKEYKLINRKYETFLLERYIRKYKFSKTKIITKIENFYKSYRHLIKINDGYVLEETFLKEKYEKK